MECVGQRAWGVNGNLKASFPEECVGQVASGDRRYKSKLQWRGWGVGRVVALVIQWRGAGGEWLSKSLLSSGGRGVIGKWRVAIGVIRVDCNGGGGVWDKW